MNCELCVIAYRQKNSIFVGLTNKYDHEIF
jgi:hypothetical protein